jgi:hypothetical protein
MVGQIGVFLNTLRLICFFLHVFAAIPQPHNDIIDGSGRALDNRFWVAQYDADQKISFKKSTGGVKLKAKLKQNDEPAIEQKQLFRPRSRRSRRFTKTKVTTLATVETQASVLAEINSLLTSMQAQVKNCL